ncbi:(d)CMP kinase [Nocardia sp. NBC_01499]|uniref:uridine kinase family protein n=1 Tax=Nocardia sp. NBC_01499 TaxID=2903597 RepID=UPI00386ACBAA
MLAEVVARVVASEPRLGSTRLVAVDGPGGAGKSTLAGQLAREFDASVVPTDSFASWDNTLDWWSRLESQVLEPLGRDVPARYQRYDWDRRALAEWHVVEPGGVVVLEGVSSSRAAVRARLSLAIWVDTPRPLRLARGLERDGSAALPLWEQWMADEDNHFVADNTRAHADIIVSGTA